VPLPAGDEYPDTARKTPSPFVQESFPMTDGRIPNTSYAPELPWAYYEDLTQAARRTGISYSVLLDPRIRSILTSASDIAGDKPRSDDFVTLLVLAPLRFLLDRFPTLMAFRFSVGPGPALSDDRPSVLATFGHDDERGYFVALSLDLPSDGGGK
jgi:hypothetical protein